MSQILTVGPNQQFSSIQSAIDYLSSIVAGTVSGTLPDSYTIEVWEGNYGGFIIQPSSVTPTATNTLTIKSRANSRVVISGTIGDPNLGHGYRTIGIGIGDNNPYVRIYGFIIENFHKGIVLSAACHNAIIGRNIIRINKNVGLWVYRSERCQVLNNLILDHDNGLVVSEVNDVLVANNDLINITPPNTNQITKYNVHVTTKVPSSYSPNGTIIFYNNNIVSNGGILIGYGNNVIAKLRSNNNNLYNSNGLIGKGLNDQVESSNLGEWQTVSINDQSSISVPADYYIPTQAGSSVYTTIALGNYILYGGISRGFSLCNAQVASTGANPYLPHGVLPNYSTTSLLCETIQSNSLLPNGNTSITRPSTQPPSIGSYDISFDPYGFASSFVLPVGSPGSGTENSDCLGGIYSAVNLIEEKFGQSVDCINPSFVPGFFYIHDIQHYLYASKAAYKLSDITVTDIVLASHLQTIDKVLINGEEITESSWELLGTNIRIRHKDLGILDLDAPVIIIGQRLKWYDNTFSKETFTQRTRLRDHKTRYFLPVNPTRAAPIVITDDMVNYQDDPYLLGREFTTKYDQSEDKIEVIFAGSLNYIENPQFDYIDEYNTGSYPANWTINACSALVTGKIATTTSLLSSVESSGKLLSGETLDGFVGDWFTYTGYTHASSATGALDIYPVLGNYFCVLTGNTNTGGISQTVKVDPNKSYWFSTYAAAIKETGSSSTSVSTNMTLTWTWLDESFKQIGRSTNERFTGYYPFTPSSTYIELSGVWNRYALGFSNYPDNTLNKSLPTGILFANTGISDMVPIPSGAFYIDLRLSTTSKVALDCVSFTESRDIDSYSRRIRGNEATIEYDTGLTDLYTPDNLTITPVRNLNSNGFLYIAGLPARQFDEYALENTTTLTDWGWATGRLSYLPWSRTSGKNKLRKRAKFNLGVNGIDEPIAIAAKVPYPDDIQMIPRVPIANMGEVIGVLNAVDATGYNLNGIYGSEFVIKVTDNNGNPYGFEYVTASLLSDFENTITPKNIGILGIKELGIYTKFSQSITTRLDSAGIAIFKWIPPAGDECLIEVNDIKNIIMEQIEGKTYYRLPDSTYRINSINMGNPFLSTPLNPTGYYMTGNSRKTEVLGYSSIDGNNRVYTYKLKEVPYRHTLDVWINKTGNYPLASGQTISGASSSLYKQTYDLMLTQSEVPEIKNGYYYVDESKKLLHVSYSSPSRDPNKTILVEYNPRSIFLLADNNGNINNYTYYIETGLYQTLSRDISKYNPLSISHDITIDMVVKAHAPTGMQSQYMTIYTDQNTGGTESVNLRERYFNARLLGKSIAKRVDI